MVYDLQAAAEKTAKQIQQQIAETTGKLDEMNRTLNDFDSTKKKLSAENNDLQRQIEEAESQIGQLSKLKLSLTNQLEDHRKLADEESRVSNISYRNGNNIFKRKYILSKQLSTRILTTQSSK